MTVQTPGSTRPLPGYERAVGVHPPLDFAGYAGTRLRHPGQPLVLLAHTLTELTGPVLGGGRVRPGDNDLTVVNGGQAQGQRIIVHGQVRDSDGRPVPDTLIEIWQANAGGRYLHLRDQWPSPVDPHFAGAGRALTDSTGHYSFTTIKPGAYPWSNHYNAWRPAHIHFSLFGRAFTQRLVTQMYFPDDPLFFQDPIFNSIPDPAARQRLIARFDYQATLPDRALAFRFDLVLRGQGASYFETEDVDGDAE